MGGTQTAVQLVRPGSDHAAALAVTHDKPIPAPGPGEALVRVRARPVNPSDFFSIELPVADEVSDEDAAQYLINPVTALGFLEDLKVPTGEYLLQNAANSILGQELISMAKRRGTRTINVVRRREVVNMLKSMGADEVICSADEDIVKRTMQITGGKGAWAAINPVGGPASKPFPQAVRDSGLVYIYSLFLGEVIVPMYDLHFRDITVRGFWLTKWLNSLSDEVREEKLQEVMHLMAQGVVKPPPPSAKFPLEDVHKAVKLAEEKSGKEGKVLLVG